MKLSLYKKAKFALTSSLRKGSLEGSLVNEQLKGLSRTRATERLKLLRLYKKLVIKKLAQESVVVQSSIALDQASRRIIVTLLQKKFGDKKAVFEVNSALLGGIKLIMADTTVDYSIKGRLSQFKEAFS